MILSTNGNMYETALDEVWDIFGAYVTGSHAALVCVVHAQVLDAQARRALNSSAAALGYGDNACAFVTLGGEANAGDAGASMNDMASMASGANAATSTSASASGGLTETSDASTGVSGASLDPLDAQALFLLLEGLDPLCLIAADVAAAQVLEKTYRTQVPLGKSCRVFGRTCVGFRSFAAMLEDAQDKQVAWALLKKLPTFGGR